MDVAPPLGDPQQADLTIERIVAAAEDEAQRAAGFAAGVESLRVTCRSSGVSVTLDHRGGLVDLAVDDAVARGGGARVRTALLAAIAQGRRDVADRVGALVDAAFGAGSQTSAHLRARLSAEVER